MPPMRPRFFTPILLLCCTARCLAILDWTTDANTSDPGTGVPWASVGSVGGGSGIYLGNGWALTAAHVGTGPIAFDSGVYQPDGRAIQLTNPIGGSTTDIYLYHLTTLPNLASIPISAPTPGFNASVSLVGYGRIRGSVLQSYSTAYSSPHDIKNGYDWSAFRAKSHGTNKVAPGGVTTENFGVGPIQVFTLSFTENTQRTSQVATGDSGGGVFFKRGSTWELAGMIDALGSWVYPQQASVYGDVSYIADLATYSSQINAIVASTTGGANWSGTSGNTWSAATNWSSSPVPGTPTIRTATFNNAGGVNDTIDLGTGVSINTVLFDTNAAAAYTLGSGAAGNQTLTLSHGGAITTSSTVTNSQRINAALKLGEDAAAQTYTISNNTAASANPSLTLAGNIAGATGGTAGEKTLAVVGTGRTAITGGISTGGAASLTVAKTGTGTLDLSDAQSYDTLNTSGGTTNVNGTLGSGSSSVNVSGSGTALKFGSVSQTLSSLTIGAGATVTFSSGPASFTDPDGPKAPGFGAGPPAAGLVPEPGTTGLLLASALTLLASRRRRSS